MGWRGPPHPKEAPDVPVGPGVLMRRNGRGTKSCWECVRGQPSTRKPGWARIIDPKKYRGCYMPCPVCGGHALVSEEGIEAFDAALAEEEKAHLEKEAQIVTNVPDSFIPARDPRWVEGRYYRSSLAPSEEKIRKHEERRRKAREKEIKRYGWSPQV